MFWNRVQQGAILGGAGDTPPPPTPLVEFGTTPPTIVASELVEVSASLTILRTGALGTACSVQWALTGTMDLSDYVPGQLLSGELDFAAGDTAQVISIRIDAAVAGTPDKTIIITLSNPVECEISGSTQRTIVVDMPALVDDPGDEYPTPLRTITVTTAAELSDTLTRTSGTFLAAVEVSGSDRSAPLRGLDRVIVANGDYAGDYSAASVIDITAGPLLIMGETLYGARFTGRMILNLPLMWAVNLDFDGADSNTSTAGLSLSGQFARAHRCRFRRMQSAAISSGRTVVSVTAPDCQLYYCLFDDNDARLVSGEAANMPRFHMYRCHLRNARAVPSGGGRGAVRIGQTQVGGDGLPGSLSPVHIAVNAMVEFCLFENLHQLGGFEQDTLNIQSSANTVRQCSFIDCQQLSIRFGNDNRLESNWFQQVTGTLNRGIGVRGDRDILIANKLADSSVAIRIYAGNEDMTCARWDKTNADNFGTPRYMTPRDTEPSWPVAFSRPWSGTTLFNASGDVASGGTVNLDLPIARDTWIVANDGRLEIGDPGFEIDNYWTARNNKVRAHVGAIRTENAYPTWANVPTVTAGYREDGSTYSATVDARFLPLPTAAMRLVPADVGPEAPWIEPPGSVVPLPPAQWWRVTNRSARAWASGVAYWYDRPAPYNELTPAQEIEAEAVDVGVIDAATGSSKGDGTGAQANVATWDQVIGGAVGGAIDTSDTQFDWTASDLLAAFDDVIANIPTGVGWLIWSVVLIPNSASTATEANFAVWDEITAGNHDDKYKKFGERIVRRMATASRALDRLILDVNFEMNMANTYRVFPSTRTKYKDAMTRAINMIRQGAEDYEAGTSSQFKFLHCPSYFANIGSLISYCPENIDCVGLSWRLGEDCTSAAELAALMNGTVAGKYGLTTDLVALADTLGVPLCFPSWAPRFELNLGCQVADLMVQAFNDFLSSISNRVVADCIYHQNVRYEDGYEDTSAAGIAAWRRMVPLRKTLWGGQGTGPPPPESELPIRGHPATGKHMCLMNQYAFSSGSVYGQFSRVSSLVYRTQGLLQGVCVELTRPNGTHLDQTVDHSDQGMIDHARWHLDYLANQRQQISGLNNVLWWDLENPDGSNTNPPAKHINVPQSVINAGWQQNAGPLEEWTQYIAAYDPQAPDAFRAEAVRWQNGVLKACHALAAQRGLTNFELGTYNIPGKISQYTTNPGALNYTSQKNETQTTVFDVDGFSFGGHSMYFSTGGIRTLQQYTDFYAGCVAKIRAAYGSDHRILPAVYPRYYLGPNQRDQYPGGSFKIPANFIAPFINDLIDAGADGFYCWQASGDKNDKEYFNERWGEVVDDVILARGSFRKPGT